jgi:hypothetical protein
MSLTLPHQTTFGAYPNIPTNGTDLTLQFNLA